MLTCVFVIAIVIAIVVANAIAIVIVIAIAIAIVIASPHRIVGMWLFFDSISQMVSFVLILRSWS